MTEKKSNDASRDSGTVTALVGLYIGCPVHIDERDHWVGYIRRINWDAGIAEVGPEGCIGSHLRPYALERLLPTTFTRHMHPGLPAEIMRLQRATWSEYGTRPNCTGQPRREET